MNERRLEPKSRQMEMATRLTLAKPALLYTSWFPKIVRRFSPCFLLRQFRVADQGFLIYLADTLLTLAAFPVLYWKLRNTNDIYSMSTEIQRVCALALLALGKPALYLQLFVPASARRAATLHTLWVVQT